MLRTMTSSGTIDLFNEGLAVGELSNQVGGDAVLLEHLHQVVGDLVVDDALFGNGALLLAVEGGRVVLIGDDVGVRVVGRKDLLGFSLVELFPFFHFCFLLKS